LEEGATVILHGRTVDAVSRTLEPLRAIHGSRVAGEAADLGDRTQCRSLCRAVTDIDVLINCAGVLESRSLVDTDSGHWHRLMDMTWFCHRPVNGKPCGACAPCVYTIEEGLAWRVPRSRRMLSFFYRKLALPLKPPLRAALASVRRR
jgi:NAD(P)-dependent dehydrogenase (short-subunit alcohol dehydrogenase family)